MTKNELLKRILSSKYGPIAHAHMADFLIENGLSSLSFSIDGVVFEQHFLADDSCIYLVDNKKVDTLVFLNTLTSSIKLHNKRGM